MLLTLLRFCSNYVNFNLHVLFFATAANAIVGVAWITDWPWMLLITVADAFEVAATAAALKLGAGACCWTAGCWLAATAAAIVGAPLNVVILTRLLACAATAAAATAAAVCCWCCCWWWFLLGVELIILFDDAIVHKRDKIEFFT